MAAKQVAAFQAKAVVLWADSKGVMPEVELVAEMVAAEMEVGEMVVVWVAEEAAVAGGLAGAAGAVTVVVLRAAAVLEPLSQGSLTYLKGMERLQDSMIDPSLCSTHQQDVS